MPFKLRNIFLSKDLFIPSQNKYKRAILTGFLAILCVMVGMFYIVYNAIYLIDDAYFAYYVLIAAGILAFFLNRNGKHNAAKILILIIGDLSIFVFTTKSQFQTDAQFYYLILSLSSFAVFGYENRLFAILFSAFTVALFWISFTTGYSPLPPATYDESYIRSNQIINFVIPIFTSCIVLYFMVRLNHSSEETLNKKQEEITHQNQALTKANAELDRFVYSASHDLRAPLTSMLGLIHIANKTTDPKEIGQCLNMLESRVHRLDDFIHEIIDISRNARIDVIKQPVALKALVHDVLENLKYAKHPTLRINVEVQANIDFETDPSRLKIILSNLIGNAIKYQDLRKEDPFVHIHTSDDHRGLTIIVGDNGIGISAEHHGKLFSMFYRASDQAEGSGLGLYITKEAVEKLSGNIQFQSTYGQGSVFTVWIPR
jgi:signal transduction histidine kinase